MHRRSRRSLGALLGAFFLGKVVVGIAVRLGEVRVRGKPRSISLG